MAKSVKRERSLRSLHFFQFPEVQTEDHVVKICPEAEKIREHLERMKFKFKDIKRLYNLNTNNPWESKSDADSARKELMVMINDFNEMTRQVWKEINTMGYTVIAISKDITRVYDLKLLKWLYGMLSQNFHSLLDEFSEFYNEYNEKSKTLLKKSFEIMGQSYLDEEIDQKIYEGKFETFSEKGQTLFNKAELEDLELRCAEFLDMEKELIEVKQIFIDLSILVDDQAKKVALIDSKMIRTFEYVEDSVDHLKKAKIQKSKNRKRKVICYSFLLIILLLLIIYLMITLF